MYAYIFISVMGLCTYIDIYAYIIHMYAYMHVMCIYVHV